MSRFIKKLRLKYYTWKYRDVPDDLCCCGDGMNHGWDGSHSPKSMQWWAIESAMRGKP